MSLEGVLQKLLPVWPRGAAVGSRVVRGAARDCGLGLVARVLLVLGVFRAWLGAGTGWRSGA